MLTQSKMYYAVEEQISPSPGEEEDDSDKESVQATGQAREVRFTLEAYLRTPQVGNVIMTVRGHI